MEIREIKATEHIDECWDLLEAHRIELATHKDLMLLKPDVARYKALEDTGALFTLALYDDDEIVGYSVNVLTKNLHYSDLVYGQNDILYLRADLRGGAWGIRLIHATEERMKEAGAMMMFWHGKPDTPFSSVMPKLGYGVQDIIFSKVL